MIRLSNVEQLIYIVENLICTRCDAYLAPNWPQESEFDQEFDTWDSYSNWDDESDHFNDERHNDDHNDDYNDDYSDDYSDDYNDDDEKQVFSVPNLGIVEKQELDDPTIMEIFDFLDTLKTVLEPPCANFPPEKSSLGVLLYCE